MNSKSRREKPAAHPDSGCLSDLACGFHAVESFLTDSMSTSGRVKRIWIDSARRDTRIDTLIKTAERVSVEILAENREVLDRLSQGASHQGVIAEVAPFEYLNLDTLSERVCASSAACLLLVLDQVQDPHNLGACLRTAECAGVDAVVVSKDGTCPVNTTVRRVSAGAADRLSVVQVTNLARAIRNLQQCGVWFVGTADAATSSLYDTDLTGSIAIVMGSEAKGMRQQTIKSCDFLVSVPMKGDVSSLNVSVATGVALFEAVRQRAVSG
ncbi:MAG: 23S rRNA (guanosine(2251)-2'-O)-methyltransferase RlmB [Pseudomonadota bacterium]